VQKLKQAATEKTEKNQRVEIAQPQRCQMDVQRQESRTMMVPPKQKTRLPLQRSTKLTAIAHASADQALVQEGCLQGARTELASVQR
jgi:hypothetical protein